MTQTAATVQDQVTEAKARLSELMNQIAGQKRVVAYYKASRLLNCASSAKATLMKLAKKAAALQAIIQQAEKAEQPAPKGWDVVETSTDQ